MKNFIFMLLCAFTFVSCEQEEVWSELQTGGNENELPLTRSASDVPNAINQLDGIPVNIKSVANGRYLRNLKGKVYIWHRMTMGVYVNGGI